MSNTRGDAEAKGHLHHAASEPTRRFGYSDPLGDRRDAFAVRSQFGPGVGRENGAQARLVVLSRAGFALRWTRRHGLYSAGEPAVGSSIQTGGSTPCDRQEAAVAGL